MAGSEDEREQGMEEVLRRKEEEEDRWSEEEEEKVEEIQNGVEEEGDDELSDEKENEDPQVRRWVAHHSTNHTVRSDPWSQHQPGLSRVRISKFQFVT